jgi:hypothetical protein
MRYALLPILMSSIALGAPVAQPWGDAPRADAVAAAQLSGWYASADTTTDTIEIRDVRETLLHTITRDELSNLAPWMTLDATPDGPRALAWTSSGRSLFIVLTDDATSTDGLGSDVILRYDTTSEQLSLFARANLDDLSGPAPAALHHKGELWVSTIDGNIRVYNAFRNTTSGTLLRTLSIPNAQPAVGIAYAPRLNTVTIATESTLYAMDLDDAPPTFDTVGPLTKARGIAYSEHYGNIQHEGAFIAQGAGAGDNARVRFVPWFQVTGLFAYAPTDYLVSSSDLNDIAITADGSMLLASGDSIESVRDTDDPDLDYESWLRDEFDQVVTFAQGLVAADGRPDGWVTDADVLAGGSRFHPPSPDGAAWVVMLHLVKDSIDGSSDSAPIVRDILTRYAGLEPDGIVPRVTADGIMHHWYDPFTGNSAPGWSNEYATLSTMLIVTAADRARRFYFDDPQIVVAADTIINRVDNWDSYIQPGTNRIYFRALANGGPDLGTGSGAFNEAVMFIEQAARYGSADNALNFWLDRNALPSASYIAGFPVTTNWPGGHLPAFVSHYPWIGSSAMRDDPAWRTHMRNLLASHGAWTDDNAPDYLTVFSAGTTKPEWGGYHADSLSDHPGNVTTFPSLMAFGMLGKTAPTVGAYNAYRRGARATFATGASFLYRRSDIDPGYTPPDAGLPDVVLGAIGLAELIEPGSATSVLGVDYRPECPADYAAPLGELDFFDLSAFLSAYNTRDTSADIARPFGEFDFFDLSLFLNRYTQGCP